MLVASRFMPGLATLFVLISASILPTEPAQGQNERQGSHADNPPAQEPLDSLRKDLAILNLDLKKLESELDNLQKKHADLPVPSVPKKEFQKKTSDDPKLLLQRQLETLERIQRRDAIKTVDDQILKVQEKLTGIRQQMDDLIGSIKGLEQLRPELPSPVGKFVPSEFMAGIKKVDGNEITLNKGIDDLGRLFVPIDDEVVIASDVCKVTVGEKIDSVTKQIVPIRSLPRGLKNDVFKNACVAARFKIEEGKIAGITITSVLPAKELLGVVSNVAVHTIRVSNLGYPFAKCENATLTAAENVKVVKHTFNMETMKFETGAPIGGGLASDQFPRAGFVKPRVKAQFIMGDDNKVTEVRLVLGGNLKISELDRRLAKPVSPGPVETAIQPAATPKEPGTRYVFLVACSTYDSGELRDLPTSINDLDDFRKALAGSGFDADHIVVMNDNQERRYLPERARILRELRLLIAGMLPEDTLVVAFVGHSVQFKGSSASYFCPLDAKLGDKKTLVRMDGDEGLFAVLKTCQARRKLFLSECRPNAPFRKDVDLAALKIDRNGAVDVVPEGIAALYSCGKGEWNYEDPDRKRGLFFDCVNRAWKGGYHQGQGKLSLADFFKEVCEKTRDDALNLKEGLAQTPMVLRDYKGEWVIRDGVLSRHAYETLQLTDRVTMKLVRIEPGSFVMGTRSNERGHQVSEFQHSVDITEPIYMGIFEVTRGQFRAFVKAEKYKTDAEKGGDGGGGFDAQKLTLEKDNKYAWLNPGFPQTDDHPVVNVSWNDAMAFCAWLSRKSGKKITLPTEAEWEYACRAGTKTRFNCGEQESSVEGHANVPDNSLAKKLALGSTPFRFDDGYIFTAPVGQFKENAWGLYDMHGNAAEWCLDWYNDRYYETSPKRNPKGPTLGEFRAVRGGSWHLGRGPADSSELRSAARSSFRPDECHATTGFRVVLRSPGKETIPADGKTVAPAVEPAKNKIEIISAFYGAGNSWSDVTEKLQKAVQGKSNWSIVVTNDNLGEPAPGFNGPATLLIRFSVNGQIRFKSATRGEKATIP